MKYGVGILDREFEKSKNYTTDDVCLILVIFTGITDKIADVRYLGKCLSEFMEVLEFCKMRGQKISMNEPLVSIIMGVYNGENTIKKCIDSIMLQTYSNWEFIICDDRSKDNTYNVIKKYETKDKRITCIQNTTNRGLATSLNQCLKLARGKYIARMDADDESMPERLEKQVRFLEMYSQYDVVGTERYIVSDSKIYGIRRCVEYPRKEILLKAAPFAHPTIMMRHEVYKSLGGYRATRETIRAEDLELWFRFFQKGYQGYNIQEPLYKYTESIDDYKKRSFSAAVKTAIIYIYGYRMLKFPLYKYIYAVKPILASLIPRKIMYKYHKNQLYTINIEENQKQ